MSTQPLPTIEDLRSQQMRDLMGATRTIPRFYWLGFAFLLGALLSFDFGARWGYGQRDQEAYSNLHSYPNISWKVERSYSDPRFPGGMAHDIFQLPRGPETKDFVTCEKLSLENTIIDGMAFYYVNGCASFDGPKAWLLTHFVDKEIAGR